MEEILEGLNESQKEAATQIDGAILILAGAGSGKTKTITTRLAYLLSLGIDPKDTLTLTFTNKAAKEMRERALNLIGHVSHPPLLCTFHKFGLLFLKFYINLLGRKNNFVVIDSDDKKRILKSLMKELKEEHSTALVSSEISRYKNSLMDPKRAFNDAQLQKYKDIAKVYQKYEAYLQENNLVDFDDLLALPYKILHLNPELCVEISNKYRYIMIDEYQDTNELQFKLIKKLCSEHNNICVVGDDDQSIYGWRGANIKNILDFDTQFNDATVVKLENNYRSTKSILDASNQLIEHNRNRLGKKLVSTLAQGEAVGVFESDNENEEALKISKKIRELLDKGEKASDIAVLYRVNALSRSLEEGLNKQAISYRLVGGLRFYERAEIKDLISYLRVIANFSDDFSLKRIINKPKRGIGKVTIDKLANQAESLGKSMYAYIEEAEKIELEKLVGKKNAGTIKTFCQNLSNLADTALHGTYNLIDELDSTFKIKEFYQGLPDGSDRVSNIDEFYALFRDRLKQNPSYSLDDFLNELSLESDQDQIAGESIYIMSIHASKGLEFKHLFVIGLEEGFLPLIGDGNDIEEERRLGYVAFTRAKESLHISHVKSRFYRGKRAELMKSRFLSEAGLCKGGFEIVKSTGFKKGDLVEHKIFGLGRVLAVSKAGKDFKLNINFAGNRRDILSAFVKKA